MRYFTIILSILLTSCTVSNFYQVYKTNIGSASISNKAVAFEDQNCRVSYNLWDDGGDVGFTVYNKTDNDLIIDLTKTFFVLNGIAYEYYQNRTFSNSVSKQTVTYSYPYYYWGWRPVKVAGGSTSSNATSFAEKSELTIPAKTAVRISEYYVAKGLYLNCDLPKFPNRKKIKSLNYNESNSPYVFKNLITYKTKTDTVRMENKFYVIEISNLPASEVIKTLYVDECGRTIEPKKLLSTQVQINSIFIIQQIVEIYAIAFVLISHLYF